MPLSVSADHGLRCMQTNLQMSGWRYRINWSRYMCQPQDSKQSTQACLQTSRTTWFHYLRPYLSVPCRCRTRRNHIDTPTQTKRSCWWPVTASKNHAHCPYLLSSITETKLGGSAESSIRVDPVELDSSVTLNSDSCEVQSKTDDRKISDSEMDIPNVYPKLYEPCNSEANKLPQVCNSWGNKRLHYAS